MWHLPFLAFLAHLRDAQRPGVSRHGDEAEAPLAGMQTCMSEGHDPGPEVGRHMVRPASRLTQVRSAYVESLRPSSMAWQPQTVPAKGGGEGGGVGGNGGEGGGDGSGGDGAVKATTAALTAAVACVVPAGRPSTASREAGLSLASALTAVSAAETLGMMMVAATLMPADVTSSWMSLLWTPM